MCWRHTYSTVGLLCRCKYSGFNFSHYDLPFPTRYCIPYVRSGLYQLVIRVKGFRVSKETQTCCSCKTKENQQQRENQITKMHKQTTRKPNHKYTNKQNNQNLGRQTQLSCVDNGSIVDLTFRIAACRSLLAVAFRAWDLICVNLSFASGDFVCPRMTSIRIA